MNRIPKQVLKIAEQVKQGQRVRRFTVRSILKWFGASRRGSNILPEIRTVLASIGLKTEPEFHEAGIDTPVRFSSSAQTDPNSAAPAVPDHALPVVPEAKETPLASPTSALVQLENGGAVPESEDLPEPEVDEEPSPAKPDERPVTSQIHDWTISALRGKLDGGSLVLQPKYQREYVWNLRPELPSRLIESLLLEIPIPPIYFGRIAEGTLEVIDGQQRLKTLIDFVSNKFALRKLHSMSSLNGKFFKELSKPQREKICDAAIRTVVIDTAGNADLRYQIFERLNRGSMILNEQELRNCVYRGALNDLLAGLEGEPCWRQVKGGEAPEGRFKEREMILRFFAFAYRLPFYTGNLKHFLNDYMGTYAPKRAEELKAHAALFKQTMQNLYAVFGDKSARLYEVNRKTNKGGWDTKFSVGAFDIQAAALMNRPPAKVQQSAEQIRELFLFTLLTEPEMQDAIAKRTASAAQTKYRWTKFRGLVDPIIEGAIIEPRFFSFQVRRDLYDEGNKCKLCGNQIHCFEDSTVDHITPYSKGGKTVPENAQLAHRACNARKNAQMPMAAGA